MTVVAKVLPVMGAIPAIVSGTLIWYLCGVVTGLMLKGVYDHVRQKRR